MKGFNMDDDSGASVNMLLQRFSVVLVFPFFFFFFSQNLSFL